MADHTIEPHFELRETSVAIAHQQAMIREMIIDRMANAVLGGMLGANRSRDLMARHKAAETYAMLMAFLDGLAEAGVINIFPECK